MTRSSSTRARAKGLSCKDQCPRVCAFGDVKRFGLTCSSESFPSLICAALGWGGSHLRRQRERTVVGSGCAHIHGHEREGGVHQGRRHFRSFWTRRFREPRFREKITTSSGYPRIRGRKKNAQHGVSGIPREHVERPNWQPRWQLQSLPFGKAATRDGAAPRSPEEAAGLCDVKLLSKMSPRARGGVPRAYTMQTFKYRCT